MVRKVAVIMGSDSDWPVVKGACAQLKALDLSADVDRTTARKKLDWEEMFRLSTKRREAFDKK